MESRNDIQEDRVKKRKAEPNSVDLWLRRSLAESYASVLREPLPEEWLALLRQPAEH
jgi:hypothetical protein